MIAVMMIIWTAALLALSITVGVAAGEQSYPYRYSIGTRCSRPCSSLAEDAWSALASTWYEPKLGFLAGSGLWNVANTAEALLNLHLHLQHPDPSIQLAAENLLGVGTHLFTEFNDDIGWWALAQLRAAEVFDNSTSERVAIAATLADYVWEHARNDSDCGTERYLAANFC